MARRRETEYDGLTPGLFARSKWRSAVILKFNRVAGGADRIKKSEWKLVSHDNSPAGSRERELLLSTDSVSPCQRCHPTTLLSSASISPPLPRPSVSSSFSFSFDRFSVSFSSRGAPPRPNFSLPICLYTTAPWARGRGERHTQLNTADVYKRQTVPGRR